MGVTRAISDVLGVFVFWTIFLFFIAGATEALGLPVLSTWLTGVAFFLPRIVAALLIVLAGVLLANLAKDAVRAAMRPPTSRMAKRWRRSSGPPSSRCSADCGQRTGEGGEEIWRAIYTAR
jgi:hypothetical protein